MSPSSWWSGPRTSIPDSVSRTSSGAGARWCRPVPARAAWIRTVAGPGPLHIGVLLGNVPEYVFWLGAAALADAVIVGINSTRRGEALAGDIVRTDCTVVITDASGAGLLDGLEFGVPADRVVRVDSPAYAEALGAHDGADCRAVVAAMVLLRPPLPAAVHVGHHRRAQSGALHPGSAGRHRRAVGRGLRLRARRRGLLHHAAVPRQRADGAVGAVMVVGAIVALARRFSASGFGADVRRYGATTFTYVGKAIAYILATRRAAADDAATTSRRGFGTEASVPIMPPSNAASAASSPRATARARVDGHQPRRRTPRSAHWAARRRHRRRDPETGARVPAGPVRRRRATAQRARVHRGDRQPHRASAASRATTPTRTPPRPGPAAAGTGRGPGLPRRGRLLLFRRAPGDWMRVDSENLTAGPIEWVLVRNDRVAAAVYPVPDPRSGRPGDGGDRAAARRGFDAAGFRRFLASQPDLGTKWAPSSSGSPGAFPRRPAARSPRIRCGPRAGGRRTNPSTGGRGRHRPMCRWTRTIGGRWWPSTAATAGRASSAG